MNEPFHPETDPSASHTLPDLFFCNLERKVISKLSK